MELFTDRDGLTVATLVAAIAHSPIVVREPAVLLPAGFEAVDIAILEWLAAEARHKRRSLAMM